MIHVRQKLDTSERRTCKTIGLARSPLRYQSAPKDDDGLRLALIRLAKQYRRYGYRKVAQLLRVEGWRSITRRSSACGGKRACNCHIATSGGGFTTRTAPSFG